MSRENQLVKNTIIVSIGKISTQAISFILLPLYTAVLTTEQYGIVDLLNTYIALLVPIVTFQLEQAIFRYLIDIRSSEEDKKTLISTSFFIEIIQSIIFLIIFSIIAKFFNNDYKYFLAINVVATIFSNTMLQVCRGLGDNKTYAKGSVITTLATIIFNLVFLLVFNMGAYGMLISVLLANILAGIYILLKNKIYKYLSIKHFDVEKLKEIYKYSIPLISNSISWWIINVCDRTIITYFLGVGANGIYSAANKLSSIYITCYNIFNLTWTESVSMYINDKDASDYISNIISVCYRLFLAVCFFIIVIMPFVFPIMINENYAEGYYQIPILMLSSLCNVVVGLISAIYVAKKLTKEVAKTSIMAAIINLFFNIVLIKFIGLYAASISTLISYFAMMIFRIIHIQKYLKVKVEKNIIFSSIFMIIIIFLLYYFNNFYLNIINVIITTIYSIYINRKSFKQIINMIIKKHGK